MTVHSCQLCGSIYKPERNTSKFCGAQCRKVSSRRAAKSKKRKEQSERVCYFCGSWQMNYMGLRSDAKFCSSKCKQAAHRISRVSVTLAVTDEGNSAGHGRPDGHVHE